MDGTENYNPNEKMDSVNFTKKNELENKAEFLDGERAKFVSQFDQELNEKKIFLAKK